MSHRVTLVQVIVEWATCIAIERTPQRSFPLLLCTIWELDRSLLYDTGKMAFKLNLGESTKNSTFLFYDVYLFRKT